MRCLSVAGWMIRWFAVNRTFTAAISAPTVPKEAIAVPECAEGALPSVYQLRIVLRGISDKDPVFNVAR